MELESGTGSVVQRYLFTPLYTPQNAWSVLGWWERRRLFYNVVVGSAGLLTLSVALLTSLLLPGPATELPPLMFPVAWGIAANFFYSLGSVIDILLIRRRLGSQAGPVAQALFRYGLAFAVGLTLLPIPFLLLSFVIRLFTR